MVRKACFLHRHKRTYFCNTSSVSARRLPQSAFGSQLPPGGSHEKVLLLTSKTPIYKRNVYEKPSSGRKVARRSRDGRSQRVQNPLCLISYVLLHWCIKHRPCTASFVYVIGRIVLFGLSVRARNGIMGAENQRAGERMAGPIRRKTICRKRDFAVMRN